MMGGGVSAGATIPFHAVGLEGRWDIPQHDLRTLVVTASAFNRPDCTSASPSPARQTRCDLAADMAWFTCGLPVGTARDRAPPPP